MLSSSNFKTNLYYEQLHVVFVKIMRLKYRKHEVLLNDTICVVPMNAKKITELNFHNIFCK